MNDEQQIRDLVATWMSASRAGDVDAVLSLMTDDAVFLAPGQPPMRKADFAAASHAQSGTDRPTIDGTSDIEEIVIAGDVRRQQGRWLVARDANLLVPVPD